MLLLVYKIKKGSNEMNEKLYLVDLNDISENVVASAKKNFKWDKVIVRDDFSFLTLTIQSNDLEKIKKFLKDFNFSVKIYDCENSNFI